jgi:hypothetical protein
MLSIRSRNCFLTRPFNSLSRDHEEARRGRRGFQAEEGLSTPSLGITPAEADPRGTRGIISTPSLGITILIHDGPKNSIFVEISTPSLGITESDSGIFRLSAAFCRGAPSHKLFQRPLFEDITATRLKEIYIKTCCTFVTLCTLFVPQKRCSKIAKTTIFEECALH